MNLNIEQMYKSFPKLEHNRNRFAFEKSVNLDMKLGEITPLAIIRTAPGVTYNLDICSVFKVAPMVVPPQDTAVFKIFAFGNIDRNYWDNYKYWYGEVKNPEDPDEEYTYLFPKVKMPTSYKINEGTEEEQEVTGFPYNSFYDNIGCPPELGGYSIDATIPRADRDNYNNFFRNQALEKPLRINKTDEDDDAWENMYLRKISKPRDLITASLPTQSGSEQVEIPLGSEAPVAIFGNGMTLGLTNGTNNFGLASDGTPVVQTYVNQYGTDVGTSTSSSTNNKTKSLGITTDPTKSGLSGTAILSNAMGAPLEGLYQAIAVNTYNYLKSRGGGRYFEILSNVYGITNPEAVLQIGEFLGSSSSMVTFDTITQNIETANLPVGARASNGYIENYTNLINKSFGEFGWIFIYGVVTHYPKYQQGVSKLMQTEDPLDLFNPIFNYMGDEAIYQSEIYIQPDDVVDEEGNPVNNKVWGYNKRHSRYIYPLSEIHGRQRSSYPQSLDTNHFAEYFTEAPVLNKEFDKVNDNGFKRSLAVTDETQFIGNIEITGTIDIEIPRTSIPSPFPNVKIGV